MRKQINFDMDGTIADFYGVAEWLAYLHKEDTLPYEVAKPRLNMQSLARVLNRLAREGYEIKVISWVARDASAEYADEIARAKKAWLAKHLKSVKFADIIITEYGAPKSLYGEGILFDDNAEIRAEWGEGAYDVDNIIEILKAL